MRIVERPDIKGDFVPCVECGAGTRSHRLESPRYEEYEEVWEDELEEYQGRKKQGEDEDGEEEELVTIRYRLVDAQVCMCHGCWVPKRTKAINFLNKHKAEWLADTTSYLRRIRKFLQSWSYYNFDTEISQEIRESIEDIKGALALTMGLGEEE
tara:strand:+ start:1131 stop:1592 length:462 start_codon:yes stop_codon:yes gene_type:complete